MVTQFMMLHSSFGKPLSPPFALENVEGLKKLERIEGPRLQTRESKMSEGTDVMPGGGGGLLPEKLGVGVRPTSQNP